MSFNENLYPYYVLGSFEYSENKKEVYSPHDLKEFAKISLITKERAKEVLDSLIEVKKYWKNSFVDV